MSSETEESQITPAIREDNELRDEFREVLDSLVKKVDDMSSMILKMYRVQLEEGR